MIFAEDIGDDALYCMRCGDFIHDESTQSIVCEKCLSRMSLSKTSGRFIGFAITNLLIVFLAFLATWRYSSQGSFFIDFLIVLAGPFGSLIERGGLDERVFHVAIPIIIAALSPLFVRSCFTYFLGFLGSLCWIYVGFLHFFT